jgi:CHAT domain-containing protein/tetratricopeptide (TPR) repeat protein
MEKTQVTQRLARQLVEATDLAGFLAANRESFAPETVANLKDEVDRLGEIDLTLAEPLAHATAEIARLLDDPVSLGFGDAAVARVRFLAGANAEAESLYRTAIDRLRQSGKRVEAAALERQLVAVLMRLERDHDGLSVAKRARRVLAGAGETRLVAQLDTAAGNIHYYVRAHFGKALSFLDRARSAFEELGDDRSLAFVEFNRANVLSELDRPHEALELYERAERLLAEQGLTRAAAQVSFTLAYTLAVIGRYGEALRRYYLARDLSRELGDRQHTAWAALYLADLSLKLNLLEESAALADDALDGFTAIGFEPEVARAHVTRAAVAGRRGDREATVRDLAAARDIFDRLALPAAAAEVALAQAGLALADGRLEEADRLAAGAGEEFRRSRLAGKRASARAVEAAVALARGDVGRAARLARTLGKTALRVGDLQLACRADELLGEVELARGRRARAMEAFERAVAGIEQLRVRIRAGEVRTAFLGDKLAPYERLVELNLARGGVEGLREAFRYVELAKSRSLADLMGKYFEARRGEETSGGETRLRRQLARRLEELNWYSSRVDRQDEKGEQRNARLDTHLRKEIARCERDLAELFRRLEVEDSDFASLFGSEPADLEEVARGLAADEVVVEFFAIGDRISSFVVTPDGTSVFPALADKARVDGYLGGLRYQLEKFSLGRRYADAHRSALRRCADNYLEALYAELLAPLGHVIEGRRVTFVPHGTLHYIPLHALKRPDGRYVIERSEVSYSPSATVLQLCSRRAAPDAFASDLFAVGIADERAPHIGDEIAAVGRLFDAPVLLEGADASKAAFFAGAPHSRFLHIATHGNFRHDNPMFSSVRLADGPLSFYDVFDLRLDAELVTLSACNTGMSDLAPGDELCGLMRGFLYAGAPSLVVSLWAVNDRSTAEIMEGFYAHLRAGRDKRAALRLAELEALERFGHPYYWAPFVLMGKV